jgi:BMFP domain-containing protein YqiC
MPRPYALNIPSPRTVIATLLRPLLERLVLWYLRDIAAQQSEVNAEVIRRITSLESDLRQDFKAALDGQVASLDATLRQDFKAALDGQVASLDATLRQDFKAALDGQVASLDATLRQDFKAALDELAAQTRALSNELTAYSQRSTLPFQILANQVASLADLVGSCLVVLSRDSHSSSTISIVDNMKDQGSQTKEQ